MMQHMNATYNMSYGGTTDESLAMRPQPVEDLVDRYVRATANVVDAADAMCKAELLLKQAMEQDGATEAVSDTHKVEKKTATEYDQSRLMAALELVSEAELVKAGAYIPEHQESTTVSARFNLTKLKPFQKRGREMAEVLEYAARPGRTTLKVTEL
jgi:hypothetical protein